MARKKKTIMKDLFINGKANDCIEMSKKFRIYGISGFDSLPILELCVNGDIYLRGKLLANDRELGNLVKTNFNNG